MAKKVKDQYHIVLTMPPTTIAHGKLIGWYDDDTVILEDARMCIYYPSGGEFGLAASGPPNGSRLSDGRVKRLTLCKIRTVMESSEKADAAWMA